MERRGQQLEKQLALVMLRLQTSEVLQRVEIEAGANSETLTAETEPGWLRTAAGRLALAELNCYLCKAVAAAATGSIRFVERGAQVVLTLRPGEVKLNISTLAAPVQPEPVATGTRQQFIKVNEALELLRLWELPRRRARFAATGGASISRSTVLSNWPLSCWPTGKNSGRSLSLIAAAASPTWPLSSITG